MTTKKILTASSYHFAVIPVDVQCSTALTSILYERHETPKQLVGHPDFTAAVFGSLRAARGHHNIIIFPVGAGLEGSLHLAICNQIITRAFEFEFVVVLGTCGSADITKVKMGDGIFTTGQGIYQGDFVNGVFVQAGHLNPPGRWFCSVLTAFESDNIVENVGVTRMVAARKRMSDLFGIVPEEGESKTKKNKAWHTGSVLSCSIPLADEKVRDRIQDNKRLHSVVGVETSIAGLNSSDEMRYLGVFGTSHLCDSNSEETHKKWHPYAAGTAAALFATFLESGPARGQPAEYVGDQSQSGAFIRPGDKRPKCPNLSEFEFGILNTDVHGLAATSRLLSVEYQPLATRGRDCNIYTFGRIGNANVVICSLASGLSGGVTVVGCARNFRTSFPSIRRIILHGCATKVPSSSAEVGDIVLSSGAGVLQGIYRGGSFLETGHLSRPKRWFLTRVNELNRQIATCDSSQNPIAKARSEIASGLASLKFKAPKDSPSVPQVHEGCIMSSLVSFEKSVPAVDQRAEFKFAENVVGLDESAAGIAADDNVDYFVVAGIYDPLHPETKGFAATSTAAYIKCLIAATWPSEDVRAAEISLAQCDNQLVYAREPDMVQLEKMLIKLRLDFSEENARVVKSLTDKLTSSQHEIKLSVSAALSKTEAAMHKAEAAAAAEDKKRAAESKELKSVVLTAISDSTLRGFPYGCIIMPKSFASLSTAEKIQSFGETVSKMATLNFEDLVTTEHDLYVMCEAQCDSEFKWHRLPNAPKFPIKKLNASFKPVIPYVKAALSILKGIVPAAKLVSGRDFSEGVAFASTGLKSLVAEEKLIARTALETPKRFVGEELQLIRKLVSPDDTSNWQDQIAGLLPASCTRKGPLGKEGSFFWLCPAHHHLMTKFNEGSVTEEEARAACISISEEGTLPMSLELPSVSLDKIKIKHVVVNDAKNIWVAGKNKASGEGGSAFFLGGGVDEKTFQPVALPSKTKKIVSLSADGENRLWAHVEHDGVFSKNTISRQISPGWDEYSPPICAGDHGTILSAPGGVVCDASGAVRLIEEGKFAGTQVQLPDRCLAHSASSGGPVIWIVSKDKEPTLYSLGADGKWTSWKDFPAEPLSVHSSAAATVVVSTKGALYALSHDPLTKWRSSKWRLIAEGVMITKTPRELGVCGVGSDGTVVAALRGGLRMWKL